MRQIIRLRKNQLVRRAKNQLSQINPTVLIALITLFFCQIADGLLTYYGVTTAGTTRVEGNLLLRFFMDIYGPYLTLLVSKSAACMICILVFFLYPKEAVYIDRLLCIVTTFYLIVVTAWVIILL